MSLAAFGHLILTYIDIGAQSKQKFFIFCKKEIKQNFLLNLSLNIPFSEKISFYGGARSFKMDGWMDAEEERKKKTK